VIACLVEMGEVVARLVVHATQSRAKQALMSSMVSSVPQAPLDRQSVLMVLDRMTGAATK
jgi:antitoxin (DNA-binding transcriptional repressor) of toxin-antitoxin stability system